MINKNLMSKADLRTIAKSIENRPKTQSGTWSETMEQLDSSLSKLHNLQAAMQPILLRL